jgi:hypothetical protein
MRGRKLSVVTLFVFLGITALPHKNGYGTPVLEETLSLFNGGGYSLRRILIAQEEIDYWTCPMHTDVKMEEPGKCPECGMDLIPVMKKPDSGTQNTPDNSAEKNGESPDTDASKEDETNEHSAHGKETPPPQNE